MWKLKNEIFSATNEEVNVIFVLEKFLNLPKLQFFGSYEGTHVKMNIFIFIPWYIKKKNYYYLEKNNRRMNY